MSIVRYGGTGGSSSPADVNDHINDTTDAHDASAISFDVGGSTLAAANVQAAIEEVEDNYIAADATKADLAGDTFTGDVYLSNAAGAAIIGVTNATAPVFRLTRGAAIADFMFDGAVATVRSLGTYNLALATNNVARLTFDGTTGVGTFSTAPVIPLTDAGGYYAATNVEAALQEVGARDVGMRNRLINGDMRIDQRNAGAAVTVNSATNVYGVDRWHGYGQAADGVFTIDQSTTSPPEGFTHFTRATTTTADASIGASQIYLFRQTIEGNNVADLDWGLSTAKTVTLSFRVRSSLTGTFSGSVANSAYNRCYPFSYVINAANTWETKTITIAGDTSGTWLTDYQAGIQLAFSLGSGSTLSGTAGAWSSSTLTGVTGATHVISTNAATWDITGVQLEVGSAATPFERRPYGTEVALCRAYYQINGTVAGYTTSTTVAEFSFAFIPAMRTTPTNVLLYNGTNTGVDPAVAYRNVSAPALVDTTSLGCRITMTIAATTANKFHHLLSGAVAFYAEY